MSCAKIMQSQLSESSTLDLYAMMVPVENIYVFVLFFVVYSSILLQAEAHHLQAN